MPVGGDEGFMRGNASSSCTSQELPSSDTRGTPLSPSSSEIRGPGEFIGSSVLSFLRAAHVRYRLSCILNECLLLRGGDARARKYWDTALKTRKVEHENMEIINSLKGNVE